MKDNSPEKKMLIVPRITNYTPIRAISRTPDVFDPHEGKAEISVVFTYDIEKGEYFADCWKDWGWDIKIGGVAYDDPGGEFVPGKYTKKGVVITHRGCIRDCPFCYVPRREGKIRCIEIKEGNILQDNNILACPKDHQRKVFAMLRTQKAVSLRGGIDSRLFTDWTLSEIVSLRLADVWLAYDSVECVETLRVISKLREAGISKKKIRCYILIGYDNDTFEKAEERCMRVYKQGALPFAQLYDQKKGNDLFLWKKLARIWSRPAIYASPKYHEGEWNKEH